MKRENNDVHKSVGIGPKNSCFCELPDKLGTLGYLSHVTLEIKVKDYSVQSGSICRAS